CLSGAVAVGATDNTDAIAGFSNRGPLVDLFAPGVSVTSSVPGGAYGPMSGTSMSAPHVAGSFAVLRQAFPGLDAAQALRRLRETGTPVGPDRTPRVDLGRAVSSASQR